MATVKELEERVSALEALVERLPHVKSIRLDERRVREVQARRDRRARFEATPAGEHLAHFNALCLTEQRQLAEDIAPQVWVEILRSTSPADRPFYLCALQSVAGGAKTIRFVSFMLCDEASLPTLVDLEYIGNGVSIDLRGLPRLCKGSSFRMFRDDWQRVYDDKLHGEMVRGAVKVGDLVARPVEGDARRHFCLAAAEISPPNICKAKAAKAA